MDTVRARLDLAYDGTFFHGWAAQPGLRTVEGELVRALSLIARQEVAVTVAGRTDAGVHADHQVAHVDLPAQVWDSLPGRSSRTPEDALVDRLASLLTRAHGDFMKAHGLVSPRGYCDVALLSSHRVPETFDARFSAVGRHYVYRLLDQRAGSDPFSGRRIWTVPARQTLNLEAMAEAASSVIGEHDFLSFCKPREGATTIRTLRQLDVVAAGETSPILVRVHADAFCHSMVRSLVGALIDVGTGRRSPAWMRHLLDARSREAAAPLAPAHGLTLAHVDYPPANQWAQRAQQTRAVRSLGCC